MPEPRVAVIAGLLLAACGRAGATEAALGEGTMVVERGTLQPNVLLAGELDAAQSIELTVPVTEVWQLSVRWMAEDGATVKKGERVLELDNSSILEKIGELELAVAEASVELASQEATTTVAVEDKKMEVETKRTEVEKARLDVGIPEELTSRYDASKAKLALMRAEAALVAAEEDLRAARQGGKLDLEVKQIALAKAERALEDAERQLDSLTLTAPRDGVVVISDHPWEGRKFQVGDMVWPGMSLAKLPNLSEITVEATLNDVDDGRVAVGMRARCAVDAFPEDPVGAQVRSVSPVARPPGPRSSVRSFRVVLVLDETDPERMRPGLSVQVEVFGEPLENALLVPRAALSFEDAGQPRVRRAGGELADVTVDACSSTTCAVSAGVAEGDEVRGAT